MNSLWLKIKPWLGLVSVFLVGVLLGSVLTMMVLNKRQQDGPPRRGPEMFINKLEEKLSLTPAQKEEITKILKSCEPRIQQANRDKSLAMAKIFEESRQKIRATLTAEQQVKYDELMKNLRERWEKDRKNRYDNKGGADRPPGREDPQERRHH